MTISLKILRKKNNVEFKYSVGQIEKLQWKPITITTTGQKNEYTI